MLTFISNAWQYFDEWVFNKNHIFDEYEKNILETSIEAIDASPNLTTESKQNQIRAMKINFINQYCFINIGQILTRSMKKFEQFNIASGKATYDEGQFTKHRISESQSCALYFGLLLGYALSHVAIQVEYTYTRTICCESNSCQMYEVQSMLSFTHKSGVCCICTR